MMIDRESLIVSLHDLGAIHFGDFVLRTGEHSPIYVDVQALVSRPPTLRRVARMMQSLAKEIKFDRLAAIPPGGLAIAMAYSLTVDLPLIYPRHVNARSASGRYIAGNYKAGETLLLIDDVLAHGSTKLETINLMETVRLHVKDVMVLLDRGLGGRADLEERGYRVHTVLTMTDILDTLLCLHRISADQHRFVSAWLAENQASRSNGKVTAVSS